MLNLMSSYCFIENEVEIESLRAQLRAERAQNDVLLQQQQQQQQQQRLNESQLARLHARQMEQNRGFWDGMLARPGRPQDGNLYPPLSLEDSTISPINGTAYLSCYEQNSPAAPIGNTSFK